MKDVRYVSYVTSDHWTAKNKLHEAILELAKKMDHKLMANANEARRFIWDMKMEVERLNAVHKRCKPFNFYASPENDGHRIYVTGIFYMELCKVSDYEPKDDQ